MCQADTRRFRFYPGMRGPAGHATPRQISAEEMSIRKQGALQRLDIVAPSTLMAAGTKRSGRPLRPMVVAKGRGALSGQSVRVDPRLFQDPELFRSQRQSLGQ